MLTPILIFLLFVSLVQNFFTHRNKKILTDSYNQQSLKNSQLQNKVDIKTKEISDAKERIRELNLELMEAQKQISKLKASKTNATAGDLIKLKETNRNLSKEISRYKKMIKSKDRYIDKMKGQKDKKEN